MDLTIVGCEKGQSLSLSHLENSLDRLPTQFNLLLSNRNQHTMPYLGDLAINLWSYCLCAPSKNKISNSC
ncbi:hypothetical protein KFK09_018625 [Dendrobium nobile]|uniref:Uncharacterized protein n=1 Tax=Dendrobium nobile TaxID=94219 RepID=A0A8T3AVB2_DENNO|nr:hypothetical protein KFK09_018625 [Dendrobium nobile]